MATKKRGAKTTAVSKSRISHDVKPIFATVVGSLLNMTVTAVTSGAVLVCLFAAKRFV
jgi:hypothetical protein